ncbi:GntR family transcriptional regulator [Vagococcus sp.]|uniref:GntR family transcriptional regulator n=1 Tax=Vagococcus sp. TaxID=1933889 RepID=UPI003F9C8955
MKQNLPLYQTIANTLTKQIIEGTFKANDKLPTEEKLCKNFNVSRVTIRQALAILVEKRIVEKKQGSGTRIIYSEKTETINKSLKIKSFHDDMIELGKIPSSKVKKFELREADKRIASLLQIEEEELVFYYERILLGDSFPCSFETGYLPLKPYPDFSIEHLNLSKFNYIENIKKEVIDYSHQNVDAILASKKEVDYLDVREGSPLVKINLITYLDTGKPLDYVSITFNPANYHAHFVKYR